MASVPGMRGPLVLAAGPWLVHFCCWPLLLLLAASAAAAVLVQLLLLLKVKEKKPDPQIQIIVVIINGRLMAAPRARVCLGAALLCLPLVYGIYVLVDNFDMLHNMLCDRARRGLRS